MTVTTARQFIADDIQIPDYRIELWTFDRDPKTGEKKMLFLADISNIAISQINIIKERNLPDSCNVTIEYTQFKRKLAQEGSESVDVLRPLLTDVKIKRNFETVFCGTLHSMNLVLSAIGKESLTLQCYGYMERLNKRLINSGYYGMSYPEIAQQMIYDCQHEVNWFDNYAFESTGEEYFDGWEWSAKTNEKPRPPRASPSFNDGGVALSANQWIEYTVPYVPTDVKSSDRFHLSFYSNVTSGGTITVTMTPIDNSGNIVQTFNVSPGTGSGWVKQQLNSVNTNGKRIKKFRISTNVDVRISDFQFYRPPKEGDKYDLGLKVGYIDPNLLDKKLFPKDKMRHYHYQRVKDGIYNLSKLKDENFEYEVDENRNVNFYLSMGNPNVDKVATYPGELKEISITKDATEIVNIEYGYGQDESSYSFVNSSGIKETQTASRKWGSYAEDMNSSNLVGALVENSSFENIQSQEDIDEAAESKLNIFADIQSIPEIKIDSNVYNPSNVKIGDAFGLNVLADRNFSFINGEYRIFSYTLNVSIDSVESMDITLISPNVPQIQVMNFPKTLKNMQNNIIRLLAR